MAGDAKPAAILKICKFTTKNSVLGPVVILSET
jgi:hypothetical protein